jgi:hypothetical protein
MNVGLAFDAPLKECANHLYQEIIYEEPTSQRDGALNARSSLFKLGPIAAGCAVLIM